MQTPQGCPIKARVPHARKLLFERVFAMNPSLLSDNSLNEGGAATGIERTSEAWEDLKKVVLPKWRIEVTH
jgi:hypothetical protein